MSPYFISCWIFNRWVWMLSREARALVVWSLWREHFIRACSGFMKLGSSSRDDILTPLEPLWNMLKSYLFKSQLQLRHALLESSIKRACYGVGAEFSRFPKPMMMMVENAICMHVITYAKSCHMQKPSLPPMQHLHTGNQGNATFFDQFARTIERRIWKIITYWSKTKS